jgi:1-deoxy-D-xylulose-5-phosphate synthase
VNARFVKPIDAEMVARTLSNGRFVVTVEEGCLAAGFGSAFIESAVAQRLNTQNVKTLALPDRFIEHGDRNQLLADAGISPEGIARACREMLEFTGMAIER